MIKLILSALSAIPSKYRNYYIILLIFGVILSAVDSYIIFTVPALISGVFEDKEQFTAATSLIIMIGFALVLKNIFFVLYQYLRHLLLSKVHSFYSKVGFMTTLQDEHDESGKSSAISIIEPLQVVLNIYAPIMAFIVEGALGIVIMLSLLYINPVETMLFGSVVGLTVYTYQFISKKTIASWGVERQVADGRRQQLSRYLQECGSELRIYGAVQYAASLFMSPTKVSVRSVALKSFVIDSSKNVIELSVILSIAIVVSYSYYYKMYSVSDLLGILSAFGFAAYRLMPTLNRLLVSSQSIRFGTGSFWALNERAQVYSKQECKDENSDKIIESLNLRLLDYELANGTSVTRNLRLRLGDILIIKGPSGIGKSTLLKRMLFGGGHGLELAIGEPETNLETGGLHGAGVAMSFMSQNAVMFTGSIADNIWLGRDETGYESSLNQEFVELLGLDLERNIQGSEELSGGQRLKVSAARAYGRNACIRIFDEPTSALDSKSKADVVELITKRRDECISIVISHDDVFDRYANEVLYLGGKL